MDSLIDDATCTRELADRTDVYAVRSEDAIAFFDVRDEDAVDTISDLMHDPDRLVQLRVALAVVNGADVDRLVELQMMAYIFHTALEVCEGAPPLRAAELDDWLTEVLGRCVDVAEAVHLMCLPVSDGAVVGLRIKDTWRSRAQSPRSVRSPRSVKSPRSMELPQSIKCPRSLESPRSVESRIESPPIEPWAAWRDLAPAVLSAVTLVAALCGVVFCSNNVAAPVEPLEL